MKRLALATLALLGCPRAGRPPPDQRAVLLGAVEGSTDALMPLVCWSSRARSFLTGPACDGIVPVGAQWLQAGDQVRVAGTQAWSCRTGRRAALRLHWLGARDEPLRRRSLVWPLAWPDAVARTMARPTASPDSDQEPSESRSRAARIVSKILQPATGWQLRSEVQVDLDGDGRGDRFLSMMRPKGVDRSPGCPSVESVLLAVMSRRPEQPLLVDRRSELGLDVYLALDLDGDGTRELFVDAQPFACAGGDGQQALLRISGGVVAVLARWDGCGTALRSGPHDPR